MAANNTNEIQRATTETPAWAVNDRILRTVQEKVDRKTVERLYDAKILAIAKGDDGEPVYRIHYQGWHSRFDEWVSADRMSVFDADRLKQSEKAWEEAKKAAAKPKRSKDASGKTPKSSGKSKSTEMESKLSAPATNRLDDSEVMEINNVTQSTGNAKTKWEVPQDLQELNALGQGMWAMEFQQSNGCRFVERIMDKCKRRRYASEQTQLVLDDLSRKLRVSKAKIWNRWKRIKPVSIKPASNKPKPSIAVANGTTAASSATSSITSKISPSASPPLIDLTTTVPKSTGQGTFKSVEAKPKSSLKAKSPEIESKSSKIATNGLGDSEIKEINHMTQSTSNQGATQSMGNAVSKWEVPQDLQELNTRLVQRAKESGQLSFSHRTDVVLWSIMDKCKQRRYASEETQMVLDDLSRQLRVGKGQILNRWDRIKNVPIKTANSPASNKPKPSINVSSTTAISAASSSITSQISPDTSPPVIDFTSTVQESRNQDTVKSAVVKPKSSKEATSPAGSSTPYDGSTIKSAGLGDGSVELRSRVSTSIPSVDGNVNIASSSTLGALTAASDAQLLEKDKKSYEEMQRAHTAWKAAAEAHDISDYLRKQQQYKESRERYLTDRNNLLAAKWRKDVERMDRDPERLAEMQKYRKVFEKVFPKKKQKQSRARILEPRAAVDGSAVCSTSGDAEAKESVEMRPNTVIPPILLDTSTRDLTRYVINNGVVQDPMAEHQHKYDLCKKQWTKDEKRVFKEKLEQNGKDFSKISSFLEKKTTKDCVQYYYLMKQCEMRKNRENEELQRKSTPQRRKPSKPPQQRRTRSGMRKAAVACIKKMSRANGGGKKK